MSSLWTPSGEYHPSEPARGADRPAATGPPPGEGGGPDPEELEALRRLHEQVRATPVADILANHALQLFQLAVIYLGLGAPPDDDSHLPSPHLDSARLAIDAMAALVDGLGPHLAEHEATLRDALAQIRLAHVRAADAASG